MSLTRKILLGVIIILPVLLVAAFSYISIRKNTTEQIYKDRSFISSLSARILKEKLDRLKNLGVSFATRPVLCQYVDKGQWNDAIALVSSVPRDFRFIERIFLADTSGTLMVDVPSIPTSHGKNFSNGAWYSGVEKNWEPYLSEVYKRDAAPQLIVTSLAVPVINTSGKVRGILVLQVKVDKLLEWKSEVGIDQSGFVYVVDQKGHIAANPQYELDSVIDYSSVPAVQKALRGEKNVEILYNPIAKENRLSSYEQVPGYNWAVIVQQEAEAALSASETLPYVVSFYVLAIFLAAGLAWLLVREITFRMKRDEEKIASTEKHYRHLFENMLHGFAFCKVIFDEKGRAIDYTYTDVNSEFEKLTGMTSATGKNISEMIPGLRELDPEHFERVGRVALTGKHEVFEMHVAPLNRWFSISLYSPEKGYFVGLFDNITERKIISQKLEASEKRFRALIENAQDIILLNGRDGKVIYVSPAFERLTGYSLEAMRAVPIDRVMDTDQLKESWSRLNDAIENPGVPIPRLDHVFTKNGDVVWIEGTTINLLDDPDVQAIVTNYHDITERRKSEARLKLSEANLNAIFENISEGITLIDLDGIVKAINKRAVDDVLFHSQTDIKVGDSLYDFIDAERRDYFKAIISRAHKGDIAEYDRSYPMEDGGKRWITVSMTPVQQDGKIFGTCITSRDITQRKLAEEKLVASEKYHRSLIENISDAIVVNAADSTLLYQSPSVTRILGYSEEERKGKSVKTYVHPDDRDNFDELYQVLLQKPRQPVPFQYRFRHKNGQYIWLEGVVTNLLDDPNVNAIISNYRDITERKDAEVRLAANERRFQKMIESGYDAISLTDEHLVAFYRTPSVLKITGHTAEELDALGMDLVHPEDRHMVIHSLKQSRENAGEPIMILCRMIHKMGHYEWVEGTVTNMLHDDSIKALILNYRRVTDRVKSEVEIRKLNAELEERVKQRTAQLEAVNSELEGFTYSVSHDLRSPLRIIDGFSQILVEDYADKIDNEGKKTLATIMNNAKRMGSLIDDLLDFSRLGRYHIRLSSVDMNEMVDEVLREIKDGGVVIPSNLTVENLPVAEGDSNLLKQVWTNLLSNAIKYSGKTTHPKILIGTKQEDHKTIYYVKDNGAGFDMKYYHKLFGVFQRLHHQEEFTGTGVGLALTHRILLRHGGSIWAEAKLNEGACFYFTLPGKGDISGM